MFLFAPNAFRIGCANEETIVAFRQIRVTGYPGIRDGNPFLVKAIEPVLQRIGLRNGKFNRSKSKREGVLFVRKIHFPDHPGHAGGI